jgi:hypothetical protein
MAARSEVLAVLPFTGHPGVRSGAGEWFAHKLQINPRYRVITPGAVEAQLASAAEVGLWPIDAVEAQRRGGLLGARVVVVGHIKSSFTAEIEVTVIDVSTGELVRRTSSQRGFDVAFTGLYPSTVAAVEEVAQFVLSDMKAADARERSATSGMKQ